MIGTSQAAVPGWRDARLLVVDLLNLDVHVDCEGVSGQQSTSAL